MEKAYIIYASWGTCDDSSTIGIFLDEQKADEYIKEHRKERELDEEQHKVCQKCRKSFSIFTN